MITYGRKSFDIAGYTFKAEQLCPTCTSWSAVQLIGNVFARASLVSNSKDWPVEDLLTYIAGQLDIDRMDEHSFDSGDFPKVVFVDQLLDDEKCGECREDL